jgi:thiosulfate/3-mercaptopyruvate sulfurtransferase
MMKKKTAAVLKISSPMARAPCLKIDFNESNATACGLTLDNFTLGCRFCRAESVTILSSPILSSDALAERLGDRHLVIIDCRFGLSEPGLGRSQYDAQHIPGAYYLGLEPDLCGSIQRHGGRHPLPEVETLVGKLRSLGIGPETTVIAYDDSRFAFAARLWWLLRYFLGHERVAVLDGGWSAWVAAGLPTTADLPSAPVGPGSTGFGTLEPRPDPSRWVTMEQVKARLAGTVLVDSRSGDRYRGEVEPIDPIAGHIPGAVNGFWQEVTDEAGFVLSARELGDRWQKLTSTSDVGEMGELMVYCGSGVTACVNLLSLELAGISQGKLYAGSWSDWCSYLV